MRGFVHSSSILAERSAMPLTRAEDRRTEDIGRTVSRGAQKILPDAGDALDRALLCLDRYLVGWAEGNVDKIVAATADGYRFDDPLVGRFCRRSLASYFVQLQVHFAGAGPRAIADVAFVIRRPPDAPPRWGRQEYCREAPRLGLTGVTAITIGEHGVIAEYVSYDLNPASHALRNSR